MLLTEIRGFTAEEDIFLYPIRKAPDARTTALLCADGDLPLCGWQGAGIAHLCRITIHAIGARGKRGLPLELAKFCRLYRVEPRFFSCSDMGIAFFVPNEEKERVLDALSAYFPMWE